jgi:hypothetical protein
MRDDLEKRLDELGQAIGPDDSIVPGVMRRIDEEFAEEPVRTETLTNELLIRRLIMSRFTRYAAAAVIIIGVVLGFQMFKETGKLSWAIVAEQLNDYTKCKWRQRVVRQKGPDLPVMDVYHLNLSQRRQEVEDGSIHIIDMRGADAITVELYPDTKKATVTKLIGFGPRKDPHIIEMVKRFEQESTERLGTKKLDGKTLQGFRHQPNKHNDFTVWVDPDTKLPVEIELVHPKGGQTIFLDQFEFDFELDPSAFSTDIPDGYEVKTIIRDRKPVESKEITAEDIRSELDHTAYTVDKLPWAKKISIVQTVNPLSRQGKVYLTGIQTNDENVIVIVQGISYDAAIMVWIPRQQLALETPIGIKLYTHPRGSEYARSYLKSFGKANPEFFDIKNLSEERFTRMIVMSDGTIMGLSANKQMSNKELQELVESLIEIEAN